MKKPKKLTARQQAALKRHSVHHTAKHMAEMRKSMRAGKTFTEAHRVAMRKVGKWGSHARNDEKAKGNAKAQTHQSVCKKEKASNAPR
jgi:hypothetical protein